LVFLPLELVVGEDRLVTKVGESFELVGDVCGTGCRNTRIGSRRRKYTSMPMRGRSTIATAHNAFAIPVRSSRWKRSTSVKTHSMMRGMKIIRTKKSCQKVMSAPC
jgi:hypothetical protein